MDLEGVKVLLVEDEDELGKILSMSLGDHDAEVVHSLTVADSIAALAGTEFDVVVCDAHLPDGDYLTVLQAAFAKLPDAILFIMTGEPSLQAPPAPPIAGILRKPDDMIDLSGHLMKALGRTKDS